MRKSPFDWFDRFVDHAMKGDIKEMKKILSRAEWRKRAILWNLPAKWDSSGSPFITTAMFLCTRGGGTDGAERVVIPEMVESVRFLTELWADSGRQEIGSPWSDFSHPLSVFSVSSRESSPQMLSLVSDMCIMGMSLDRALRTMRVDMVASDRPGLRALLLKGPMDGVVAACDNGDLELARALLDSVFKYPRFQDAREWAANGKVISALMRTGMFEEAARLSPEKVVYGDLIRGQEIRQEKKLPPFDVPEAWWSCLSEENDLPYRSKGERGLDRGFVCFCRLAAKGESSEGRTSFLRDLASRSSFPEVAVDAGSALLNLLANGEDELAGLMSGTRVSLPSNSCLRVMQVVGDVPRCDDVLDVMLKHDIARNEWFHSAVRDIVGSHGTPSMASRVSLLLDRMGMSIESLVSASSSSLGKQAASDIESFLLMRKALPKDSLQRRCI